MSENEQMLKGIDDPEYPIYEMYTDENGNPVVRISRKVTILTQEESKQVLERFKNLEAENAELRKLAEDLHSLACNALPRRTTDYMTICSVEWCIDYYSKTMPEIEQRMQKLGVERTVVDTWPNSKSS